MYVLHELTRIELTEQNVVCTRVQGAAVMFTSTPHYSPGSISDSGLY